MTTIQNRIFSFSVSLGLNLKGNVRTIQIFRFFFGHFKYHTNEECEYEGVKESVLVLEGSNGALVDGSSELLIHNTNGRPEQHINTQFNKSKIKHLTINFYLKHYFK